MPFSLCWSDAEAGLFSARGRFDPWTLAWALPPALGANDDGPDAPAPSDLRPVSAAEALRLLHAAHPAGLRGVPVGIIGPRVAGAGELAQAQELGAALAHHGLQLLCGGKSGVMEAACRGCLSGGGRPIGLIPDGEWEAANPYVAIPIATGIGPARNAILARACLALVAVGGGYGTLSEIAFGLQFERLVLTLGDAPKVEGARPCTDVAEVMEHVARRVLACDSTPG